MYYSHVLHYPAVKPFDKPDSAFFAFVGELVLPVVQQQKHEHYWFSHYGTFGRFRLYTDQYTALTPTIDERCSALGLVDKGEEKDLTLVGDLGHDRFLAAARKDRTAHARALMVLRYLHSIAELVCDNVQKGPDGYWDLERSTSKENPNGSNFESLHHLLCNMTQVPLFVHMHLKTDWMQHPNGGKVRVHY